MKRNLYHTIFNLFALSALIFIGVDIFYRTVCFRLTEISSSEMGAVTSTNIVHYEPPPLSSFDVIVNRNIFATVDTAAQDVETRDIRKEEIEALEPTSLQISLLGTVSGSEENAWAVLVTVYRPDPDRWIDYRGRRQT